MRRHRHLSFFWVLAVIFAVIAAFPSPSRAQRVCTPQNYALDEQPDFDCPGPGEAELIVPTTAPASVPVEAGQTITAEWSGALVHRDRLIYVGLRLKAVRRLRWLDTRLSVERAEIEETHRNEVAEANEEFCNQRVQHYQDQVATARAAVGRAGAWYRQFWFGLTVGLVISGALIALAAYVVTAI